MKHLHKCNKCGHFMPLKNERFCSRSCATSYNNKARKTGIQARSK